MPNSQTVSLTKAIKLIEEGEYINAKNILISLLPEGNPDVFHNLGLLEFILGNDISAIENINEAIKIKFDQEYIDNLKKIKDLITKKEKVKSSSGIISKNSTIIQLEDHYKLKIINFLSEEKYQKIIDSFEATKIDKNSHFYLKVMGTIKHRLFEYEESQKFFLKALTLIPNDIEIIANYGAVCSDNGNLGLAEKIFNKGYELNSRFPNLLMNIVVNYMRMRNSQQACDFMNQLLDLDPLNPYNQSLMGDILFDKGEWRKSLRHHRLAKNLDRTKIVYKMRYAICMIPNVYYDYKDFEIGKLLFEKKLNEIDKEIDTDKYSILDMIAAISSRAPYYIAYCDENNKNILKKYGDICTKILNKYKEKNPIKAFNIRKKDDRIHIGIISSDIKYHSVWNAFLKGVVLNLNKKLFSINIYSLSSYRDEETELAINLADKFIDGRKKLGEWLKFISNDNNDILFYPEIGMNPLVYQIAAYKPAKIQMVSWGHPETSGLSTIDYFVSSELLESENGDENYIEKLIKLPGIGTCFYPPSLDAQKISLNKLGIDEDSPIILCLGAPNKFIPKFDYIYLNIALSNKCYLVFMHDHSGGSLILEKRLKELFSSAQKGLDGCIKFAPNINREGFNSLMQRSSVLVDTVGFSGFNTAMQAIGNNLPVVTMPNKFMRSRNAAAILKYIGLDELIIFSENQLYEIINKIVNNKDYSNYLKNIMIRKSATLYKNTNAVRALESFMIDAIKL